MNKIVLSPEARNDLAEIRDYIEQEHESPDAALKTVAGITRRLRELEKNGKLGARLLAVTDIESEYCFLVCGNYRAFYRYEEDVVYVDRILYGRRDYMRVLFSEDKE
ncbi:MAG: type II toxin-antitoxin system RelE/ParE family toxin [Clostridia bacterium]|nr:type II toxin-antitoxin system RelE/ParE family toxin [Clostridia bacterium]